VDSPIVTHPAVPGPESPGEPSTTPAAGAGLVLYDKMRHAIEQCANVDEVKEVRSKATALALYKRQAGDREAEKKFAAIRIRAERRIGELLKEMGESGERDTGKGGDRKSRSVETTVKPKTLSDLGVSKDQSRKFQQLAAIPREKFERAIDTGEQVPTTAGVISVSKAKVPVMDEEQDTPASSTITQVQSAVPTPELSQQKPVLRKVRLDVQITHHGRPITRDELFDLEEDVSGPTDTSVFMLADLFGQVLRRITKEDAWALFDAYCSGQLIVIDGADDWCSGDWRDFGSRVVTRVLPGADAA
jgi:hypothetical protein